ncbi:hypothetical protein HYPP_04064 [Hyphomicrobium sp. ghe19]|nr:hypothetical protein HYPP_04064 [Hyphomicrobium sp. ghe19]
MPGTVASVVRKLAIAGLITTLCFVRLTGAVSAQTDALPSWNAGLVKQRIIDFVGRVTKDGGADFVPEAHRIAVFDNDGTLWAEQPIYSQFQYAIDQVSALAPAHPEWSSKEPFKGILAGDTKAALASGERGVAELMAVTHSGMTTEAFGITVDKWLEDARHPTTHRPYTQMVYQPMLELMKFLRANGFKTFIVSGGGVEFMRRFAERVHGIPPEQVVGSSGTVKFEMDAEGRPLLVKESTIDFIDDGPGKPVGINRFIGRRPILAFGNSDGDQQMLEWTAAGEGPRFMGLVHHTDAAREWAYDRKSPIGKLDKALTEATAKGWMVVDMKADWKDVFPPEN